MLFFYLMGTERLDIFVSQIKNKRELPFHFMFMKKSGSSKKLCSRGGFWVLVIKVGLKDKGDKFLRWEKIKAMLINAHSPKVDRGEDRTYSKSGSFQVQSILKKRDLQAVASTSAGFSASASTDSKVNLAMRSSALRLFSAVAFSWLALK